MKTLFLILLLSLANLLAETSQVCTIDTESPQCVNVEGVNVSKLNLPPTFKLYARGLNVVVRAIEGLSLIHI